MRTIKFRAWDHGGYDSPGKMLYVEEFPIYHEIDNGFHSGTEDKSEGWRTFELMQFTGLHDRNGVEIYEGDVIRWDGSVIGCVSFSHCEFVIGEGVNARAMCALRDGQAETELEVIGNIFESPELVDREAV